MLRKYQGCLLGAVLGDALAMPNESTPARNQAVLSFAKAYKGHPNENLLPGQYTDDGQIILIAARNLVAGEFSKEDYVHDLLRTYNLNKFRYPDGATLSACKKMEMTKKPTDSGVYSDSAGCLSLAVPFALAFSDKKEMAHELVGACMLTQTHPAVHAGTLGFALMLKKIAETGSLDDGIEALRVAAQNMEPNLAARIDMALSEEKKGTPIGHALDRIGVTSSVYHTLPMALFLCRRIHSPNELLAVASCCGGNCGTIAMICGAVAGMRFGISALPADLLPRLERAGIFSDLAGKLYNRSFPPEPEEKNDPETADDTGEPEEKEDAEIKKDSEEKKE